MGNELIEGFGAAVGVEEGGGVVEVVPDASGVGVSVGDVEVVGVVEAVGVGDSC